MKGKLPTRIEIVKDLLHSDSDFTMVHDGEPEKDIPKSRISLEWITFKADLMFSVGADEVVLSPVPDGKSFVYKKEYDRIEKGRRTLIYTLHDASIKRENPEVELNEYLIRALL